MSNPPKNQDFNDNSYQSEVIYAMLGQSLHQNVHWETTFLQEALNSSSKTQTKQKKWLFRSIALEIILALLLIGGGLAIGFRQEARSPLPMVEDNAATSTKT